MEKYCGKWRGRWINEIEEKIREKIGTRIGHEERKKMRYTLIRTSLVVLS